MTGAHRDPRAWVRSTQVMAGSVAAAATRFSSVAADGGDIYWLEQRPFEAGRTVIVRRSSLGEIADMTPPPINVRTRVYEYGGGAYAVSRGVLYYSNFTDGRVYRLKPGESPEPVTPAGDCWYADFTLDPARPRLVCLRQRQNEIAIVSLPLDGATSAGDVLVSGADFYATPRFSPDGRRLAWLSWRHPQMPWDGTELSVADVAGGGRPSPAAIVAGSSSESIWQPGFAPDGALLFVSDRTGWWNLYRVAAGAAQPIVRAPMEFGRPQWQLGASTWAILDSGHVAAACADRGRWRLTTIDCAAGRLSDLASDLEPGESVAATATHVVTVAGFPDRPEAVCRIDLATGAAEALRTVQAPATPVSWTAAEAIEFPTDGGLSAYAFYYPAGGADRAGRPPLIVIAHGGPTSQATRRLNLEIQFWTSRGFAVADVNYGGSTGYGRPFRDRLKGRWGIVDVADCVNAAQYLVAQGKADEDRLIIRGRSAGGYTTLSALAFRPGVFKAAASYYGIGDLEEMAKGTHWFESRYFDTLIAPYPSARDVYRQRSPIHFADRISAPVIFFQGLDDRVVAPDQARTMFEAVRHNGVKTELLQFEGEQHGFRRSETIVRCLEAELRFYAEVFGLSV